MSAVITHFEIYGDNDNIDKLAEFYREIFGWDIGKVAGIHYYNINMNEHEPLNLRGGIVAKPFKGHSSWVSYVMVDSIDDVIEKVIKYGGKIIREKEAVPKVAWHAHAADPEGNVFAIYENDPKAFPAFEPD